MARILEPPSKHTAIYIDASYLISGRMLRHLDHVHSQRITQEVVEEIRAGKDFRQNAILDNLLSDSPVINRKRFSSQGVERTYDFLFSIASTLHPFLQAKVTEVLSQDLTIDEKYKRCMEAVDHVSRNGSIWRSDHHFFRDHPDVFGETQDIPAREFHREVKKNLPRAQKSWHKYHRARFEAELKMSYKWTEERIVAAAATEALLFAKRAIIMTNDSDFASVFFQFTNNLILSHCQDEAVRLGLKPNEFWPLFYNECARYSKECQSVQEERLPLEKTIEAGKEAGLFGCLCQTSRVGDIIVYYVSQDGGEFHHYPQWLTQTVLRRTL